MKNNIFSIVVILMFWAATGAFANVGPVFIVGEQIEANTTTDVILERETIDVLLSPMSAQVVCDFYLKNTGETTTLTLAFPGKDENEGDIQNRTMKDFVVSVNEHPTPTTHQPNFKRSSHALIHGVSERYGWYIWKSTFLAGETMHIRISYTALNHNYGFTYNPYGDFLYILSTGSLWKDPIQRIDVVVRLAEMDICQITDFAPQHGRVNLDKSLTWHFENVEPDSHSNIVIWYEIALFEPSLRAAGDVGLDYLDSTAIQELLITLDFEAFQARLDHAVKTESEGYEEEYERMLRLILRNIVYDILATGEHLQHHHQWEKAIALYTWYKDTYGDIRSDLRPYSILYLRLAECYTQIGDKARAIAFFEASMDTDPMTKERYFRGLRHMFYVEAKRVQKQAPFHSKESEEWKHYFYSKGLNAYCQANLEALRRSQ